VLRRAPTLLAAFEPWLSKDDAERALALVAGRHPVLGVEVGLDAAAVAGSGRAPLLSTGMVDPLGRGLLGRELRAQHDIPQHRRAWLRRVRPPTRLKLIHREAQHIGGSRFFHPLHVKRFHCFFVNKHNRQLCSWMYLHTVQCKSSQL
jgi:hypothetical protein